MPCEWSPTLACQFGQHDPNQALRPHNGKSYCLFHLPLDAPGRQALNLQNIIDSWHEQGTYNFAGVQFPAGNYTFNSPHQGQGHWDLTHCVFATGAALTFNGAADVSLARFEGTATFSIASGEVDGANVSFGGYVAFVAHSRSVALNFRKAKILNDVALNLRTGAAAVTFRRCRFSRPPAIAAITETWPQQCDFTGSKFGVVDPAADEARHRTLRNLFSSNRSREMEGLFYAHEKRCHRRALPRTPRYWPARVFSMAYDALSSYGRSYELALTWFVGAQLAFGFWYAWASDRLGLSWQPDWQVVAFTLGQAARPFDLFTGRALTWPADGIVPNPPGVWAFVAAIHGIASLTTLALMLLALRWRFRRE